MKSTFHPILIGETVQQARKNGTKGEYVQLLGETFYKITSYDAMTPFFMSLVSSSNHWMFIASTGGLSAGRINSNHALFPFYTVDKLTENNENTGAKIIFLIERDGRNSFGSRFQIDSRGSMMLNVICIRIFRGMYSFLRRSTTIWV